MIGQFNDCFPPIMDGVSMTTYNYAYWLSKNNHPVTVVTPYAPGEFKEEMPFSLLRYPSLPLISRKPYRLGLNQFPSRSLNEINHTPFEIIHSHSPFFTGRLAMRIARKQHVPLVMTFHSKFKEDFKHSVKSPAMVRWMLRHIMQVFEAADEVWIPQGAVIDTIREYGYKGPVEVVENGNDFAQLEGYEERRRSRRVELGVADNTPIFLFVGQHIVEKNIPFIIDALDILRDMEYRMLFIGGGYGKESFEKRIASLQLEDKVSFLGVIKDREKLASYYAAADLFLFPSLYDNAPLVLREAAAMRTPGVLIEGSTSAEVVKNRENGFLVPNDAHRFAQEIREIVGDSELLERVSQNAYQTLARSWQNIAEEVYDRYQHIISRKR